VGKPEEKRPHVIHTYRWRDNIKVDLQNVGLVGGGVHGLDLAQDRDRWLAVGCECIINPPVS
jgi:hypothetical protein